MAHVRISRLTLINSILAALVVGMLFSPLIYSGIRDAFQSAVQSHADPLSSSDQRAALELQQAYINIYKKASPSVVFIKTNVLVRSGFWLDLYRQQEQAGSGFVIDKQGHIVTNNHVVAGARRIEVIFSDNSTQVARLVGRDEASDVAVIRVAGSEKLTPALLGDSDDVEVGQLAFALGAPFGLDRTFTVGTISAKQRRIDGTNYSRIQTDASINPGNSGGPLLNIFGEVVAINQSIYSTSGGNVGIGFAIPINEAKTVIDRLKREQRVIGRPTLGVQVGVAAAALRQDLGVGQREGVIVIQVLPGSAAADAGLQEYDFIYSVNNKPVKSAEDLVGEVQRVGVDGKLEIKLIREKRELSLQATVGESLEE